MEISAADSLINFVKPEQFIADAGMSAVEDKERGWRHGFLEFDTIHASNRFDYEHGLVNCRNLPVLLLSLH